MKKILTVVGNRPQLIKLDKKLKQVLCYTGQHYDECLKDVFFNGLKLPKPKYDLGEVELGKMIDGIRSVIRSERPDYVLLYGDTRSTLAGAISALYENVKIIHVEAGCRSGNEDMIEERIRKLVDDLAVMHFTTCKEDKENLELDYRKTQVYNVGATQIDSMYEYVFPTKKPKDAYQYYVMTLHRDFNLNTKTLKEIFKALEMSGKKIEFYAHPYTYDFIEVEEIIVPKNISIKEPCSYKKMINRVAFADKVITDSGGLQLEAFYLRRPCVTLRSDTEWKETVKSGWNTLVGHDENLILQALAKKERPGGDWYFYGDGSAKKKIRFYLSNL